jgi:hypothetical protein
VARVIILLKYKGMPCPEPRGHHRLEDLVSVGLHCHLSIVIARHVILDQGALEIVANGTPIMKPSKILLSRGILFDYTVRAKPLLRPPKNLYLALRALAKVALIREPYPVLVLQLRIPL